MRAWPITWEWTSDSAEVADRVSAILPSRWSPKRVSDVLEQLYALSISSVGELADLAKNPSHNPFPVRTFGDVDRLACGSHPWLYARKVSDLRVTKSDGGYEQVSWREPDTWELTGDERILTMTKKGAQITLTRTVRGALSRDKVWDRSAGSRRHQ